MMVVSVRELGWVAKESRRAAVVVVSSNEIPGRAVRVVVAGLVVVVVVAAVVVVVVEDAEVLVQVVTQRVGRHVTYTGLAMTLGVVLQSPVSWWQPSLWVLKPVRWADTILGTPAAVVEHVVTPLVPVLLLPVDTISAVSGAAADAGGCNTAVEAVSK